MERASSKIGILMTIVLAVFLNISGITIAVGQTTCQKFREPCGGFVFPPNPECCEGLECQYDGSGAFDVPGKCMPKCVKIGEFCGGFVGTQCCEGLECPGPSGFCRSKCIKLGEFCGGIAAIQCCKGLECVLDGDFPDAGGKCKQGYYDQA